MNGNIWMRRDLAAWPARRLATMGLCCRAGQLTCLAFLGLPSSPVGVDPGKLLVHVLLGSRRLEFLDKAQNGVGDFPHEAIYGENYGESVEEQQRQRRKLGIRDATLAGGGRSP
jgi:hypothetical protein